MKNSEIVAGIGTSKVNSKKCIPRSQFGTNKMKVKNTSIYSITKKLWPIVKLFEQVPNVNCQT